MKECMIYHWWSGSADEPPIKNLRTPLVLSIASLRACNKNIPIYVIDISDEGESQDFKDLPIRLNFNVVQMTPSLASYEGVAGWKNLSRLFDIRSLSEDLNEDTIIYNDTDVFWLKDPLPLMQSPDKFCFNGYNSGYFYYNKNNLIPRFFEVFEAYTKTALNDDNFRYISWQFSQTNPSYFVLDEAILCYMWHKRPELFNKIDLQEHLIASMVDANNINLTGVRMLHTNGISAHNKFGEVHWKRNYARGIVPLIVKECYERAFTILQPSEVYSQEELDYYIPLQVSLFDKEFMKLLLNKKTDDGLFDLMTAIELFHVSKRIC